jgi:hypothetical protein
VALFDNENGDPKSRKRKAEEELRKEPWLTTARGGAFSLNIDWYIPALQVIGTENGRASRTAEARTWVRAGSSLSVRRQFVKIGQVHASMR